MSSVKISNVFKAYGAMDVIHGIDIGIEHGEFVILVGPSGCGKSTLLRMIAGLESITEGEIVIDDKVINGVQPKDRDIAMVFQNYALYPQMTVAQNMGFALKLKGVPKAEVDIKVRDAAAILDLTALLERKPGQLSGGQRQRVAMGRAIVRDPKVFLFDEPLSNLDAKLRVAMRAEIKALHHRLGSTIIYVTHDQIEAMTMADKIVVMHGGNIEQIGTPLELYDFPANVFVAGFLGSPSMNFLNGTLVGGDRPALKLDDGQSVSLPSAPNGADGTPIRYGIRPEHVRITGQGSVSGVEGAIEVVEPTGSETHVVANIGSQKVICVLSERATLSAGDTIRFDLGSSLGHFFDLESGARIETLRAEPLQSAHAR